MHMDSDPACEAHPYRIFPFFLKYRFVKTLYKFLIIIVFVAPMQESKEIPISLMISQVKI
jgi:hypothetical protein